MTPTKNMEPAGNGESGMVFSIQRFSLQDGPGIRTTVFLKGCPLRCEWCSNPESQAMQTEIMYRRQNCRACGACRDACPVGAVVFEDDWPRLDRDACTLCLECVAACPHGALEATGKRMGVDEVVEEACRDEIFYGNSGGGMTLSGGEPLAQPEFARLLLAGCRERGIRTALDTTGYASWEDMRRVLEFSDLVLFDLKHLDPDAHRERTRVDNGLILENLKKTVDSGLARVWLRIPVIPDFNDSEEFFHRLAGALEGLPVEKVSLLAYHQWGKTKYEALDREYPLKGLGVLSPETLEPLEAILRAAGVEVSIDH